MKKIFFNIIPALVFSAVCFVSCDDSITGKDIDSRIIPATNVSYSEHLQPVFEVKCNISGCHEDAARAGGLALTSWAATTAGATMPIPTSKQPRSIVPT